MSREEPRPAEERAAQLREVWKRFREGRLYVQLMLSLVLVGITGLVAVGPGAPLGRAHSWLTWVTHYDYDFAGQAVRANVWAKGRGGWGAAATAVWQGGQARVQAWAERVRPGAPGAGPTVPTAPGAARTVPSAPQPAPAAPSIAPAVADPTPSSALWGLPVANAKVLNGFGWLPRAVSDKLHEGIDLAAPVATPVVAVSDGSVTRIVADPQLGYVIEARHGTLTALYAQVTAIRVQVGDQVQRGQTLAVVGKPAGAEQGMQPHLHFAVRPAGTQRPVDPAFYLGLGGSTH